MHTITYLLEILVHFRSLLRRRNCFGCRVAVEEKGLQIGASQGEVGRDVMQLVVLNIDSTKVAALTQRWKYLQAIVEQIEHLEACHVRNRGGKLAQTIVRQVKGLVSTADQL